MPQIYDVAILGAGAAGLMVAAHLDDSLDVIVIDHNDKPGAKLSITGGGRCNITNQHMDAHYFVGESYFVDMVLSRWGVDDLLDWLRRYDIPIQIEKASQYFCVHGAKHLMQRLLSAAPHIQLMLSTEIMDVSSIGSSHVVHTSEGDIQCRHLVVATGGMSYPRLGATDIGYRIAERFGHTVSRSRPALVGLSLQPEQSFLKQLSGISTPVSIRVGEHIVEGDILFAHRGITGPAVMDASLYWSKGVIEIDFVPGFDWSLLDRGHSILSNTLPLPKRMAKVMLEHLGIEDIEIGQLTADTVERLKILTRYTMAPAGTFGYAKAEVTMGGVALSQINPITMESLLRPGLYFVGEVMDVAGRLGGYNLQWAFSTAALCSHTLC